MTKDSESFPRKKIRCEAGPTPDDKGIAYANLLNSSEMAACRIVSIMQPSYYADDIDLPGLLADLRNQATKVKRGDMGQAEEILINHATALQAIFVRLMEKGMEQRVMDNVEGFIRLALRAQSQCRATLETLSAIKNPPVVYAKQANVTTGPQQINNGIAEPLRLRDNQNAQSQLSGSIDGLLPNTGTPCDAGRNDPALETMGKINRTKNPRRKSTVRKTGL